MARIIPPTRSHSSGVRPLRSLARRDEEIFLYMAESVTWASSGSSSASKVFQSRAGRNKDLLPLWSPPGTMKAMSKLFAPVDLDRTPTSTVEDVLALVRERGGRVTSARRLVLEAIFKAKTHQNSGGGGGRGPEAGTRYPPLHDLPESGRPPGARHRRPRPPRSWTLHLPSCRHRPWAPGVRRVRRCDRGTRRSICQPVAVQKSFSDSRSTPITSPCWVAVFVVSEKRHTDPSNATLSGPSSV